MRSIVFILFFNPFCKEMVMRFSLRASLFLGSVFAVGLASPFAAIDAPKKLMKPIKRLEALRQQRPELAPKRVISKSAAEWTIIAYIQADNNLAPFAVYNINDMQLATLPDSVK